MFKVYKASAGSGKTTNLVAEYLSLCLLHPDKFRHVLAITFTNNATAEMKERIVKALQTFAFTPIAELKGSDAAIYDLVKKNEKIKALSETEFQTKSQILLKKILYDYPNFTISTIDSFFQRIIRSFAFDLGINMNYNVAIDLSECYDQTIDVLLNKLSKQDTGLVNRVLFLVDRKMHESGKWQIENELRSSLNSIYNEKAFLAAKALGILHNNKIEYRGASSNELEKFVLELHQQRNQYQENLNKAIKQLQIAFKSLGDTPDLFVGGKTGIFKWVADLSNTSMKSPGSSVQKALAAPSVLKSPNSAQKALQPQIVELCNAVCEWQRKSADIVLVSQYSSSLLLLFDLKEIMDDIKLRDNLFFLNETNSRIYDEIKEDETPYLFEKIGNKYAYFFVDEFQDTSYLQWENMKPLITNALAGANGNGEGGQAILFGDVKQSIYRFRNGDSKLLNDLSTLEGVNQNLGHDIVDSQDFNLKSLSTNYRSSKSVIEFNNGFFKYLAENIFAHNELLKNYYQDVKQETPTQREGFVYVRFQQEDDGDDYLESETLKAVQDALARGYSYRDMAVLSKAKKTCQNIAQYLSAKNVPVISSDSLRLSSSAEVMLIINTLRYLLNPNDTLAVLSIVEYFCNDNWAEKLEILAQPNGFNLFVQSLGEKVIVEPLQQLQQLLDFPVFTIVKELLKSYKISQVDAYVIAFLDAVYENFNAQFSDLTQLLKWWDDTGCSLSITSSKEINAVTVTTIHQSKGLQYPIVIYPMRSYKNANGSAMAWVKNENPELLLPYVNIPTSNSALSSTSFASVSEEEKQMTEIDNANVIYVAHTRAGDGLYIITGNPKGKAANYAKFLAQYIQLLNNDIQDPIVEYWTGDKEFCKPENKETVDVYPVLSQIHSSDFTLRSDQLICGKWSSPEQELGVFIHDFLSKLKDFPQNEEELTAVLTPVETEEDREILAKVLREIMNDETLKPYFAPGIKVMNETTILTGTGQSRRPDRIVFMDDEVMVIDYKTGRENEAYQVQLDEYCHLLEQMGYQNVHSRIIYL